MHCVHTMDGCDQVALGVARAGRLHAHHANGDQPIHTSSSKIKDFGGLMSKRSEIRLTCTADGSFFPRTRTGAVFVAGASLACMLAWVSPNFRAFRAYNHRRIGASVTRTGSEHGWQE